MFNKLELIYLVSNESLKYFGPVYVTQYLKPIDNSIQDDYLVIMDRSSI